MCVCVCVYGRGVSVFLCVCVCVCACVCMFHNTGHRVFCHRHVDIRIVKRATISTLAAYTKLRQGQTSLHKC